MGMISKAFTKLAKGALEMAGQVSAYCGKQKIAAGRAMHVLKQGMNDDSNLMKVAGAKIKKALMVSVREGMQTEFENLRSKAKPVGP